MEGTERLRAFILRWQLPLIVASVVLIATATTAVYFIWFHQAYAVLFRDLRSMDAATIVAELDKRKTPYRLKDGGQTILVPENVVDATRLAVMSQELPLKGVVGFELFSKSDMGLTEFAQRINYRRALQGEIARTLMALETVESARVHLSLSEASVFREDRKPAKASVTIIPRGGRRLSPLNVRGVQRLVAAAVPDLEPAGVVVLDEAGAVISAAETVAAPAPPPDVQQQAAVEGYYAGRIRSALRSLLPDDEVTVTVAAGWSRRDGAPETAGDPFGAWSPATRRFPLSVEVATASPVGPQAQQQIQALASGVIGLRPDVGDEVRVVIGAPRPGPAEPAPEAPAQPAAVAVATPETPALDLWIWFAAPALIVLLGGAVAVHRRSIRPRRLSESERGSFAAKLRDLLTEGEGDAIGSR